MEAHDFHISRRKTEYMEYKFIKRRTNYNLGCVWNGGKKKGGKFHGCAASCVHPFLTPIPKISLNVKIGDNTIPQVTRFKYLRSFIQNDEEIHKDVNHRI